MFIPDGYANLQWLFDTSAGQDALTALGVRVAAEFDPDQLLLEAQSAFEDNLSEFIQDGFQGFAIRAVVGTATPGEYTVYELAPWEGGTATGEGLPPNVSTLIKKITPRGGRKGRGRMFLPPMAEDGVDAYGRITDSQYAALASAVDAFRTDLLASTNIIDVVLFHTDDAEPPDVVTSLVGGRNIATQRRRLRT